MDDKTSPRHDLHGSAERPGDSPLFGQYLIKAGKARPEDIAHALEEQKRAGGRLGEVLVRSGRLSPDDLLASLSAYLGIPAVKLDDHTPIDPDTAKLLPESFARRFYLIPMGQAEDKVVLAMADPMDVVAIDTVQLKLKRPVAVVLAVREQVSRTIDRIFHGGDADEQRMRDLLGGDAEDGAPDQEIVAEQVSEVDEVGTTEAASEAPVVRFVDLLLRQAVKVGASDVHIEPQEHTTLVRIRVDGALRALVSPPKKMRAAVVARIKILSHMDIAERRLPQDGRLKVRTGGRDIDVRVSSLPMIYGEKVVMRILDTGTVQHDVDRLGFDGKEAEIVKSALAMPYGMIIATGPTGSGKSTTLYAALNHLRDPSMNITTVEDPVEYRLEGINQINVKPEIGLDFSRCLRSILRQDPDIILIGEIRDRETGDIAVKSALTGHLVLSSLHTNDAPSAVTRLCDMGIERYLLASSLNLVIAQRLVRKICVHCKEPTQVLPDLAAKLRIDPSTLASAQVSRGAGCPHCAGTGYRGRMAIFEMLLVDRQVCDYVASGQSEAVIRAYARKQGFASLLDSGVHKFLAGLTTAEEVISSALSKD